MERLSKQDSTESSEIRFDPGELAVVTTVHYPQWYSGETNMEDTDINRLSDKVRGDLALQTIGSAKEKGVKVFVIDSQASHTYSDELDKLDINRHAEERKGMSASRQQGFKTASTSSGTKYVLWVEPEKFSFISDCLETAIQPILEGGADIVIPKRNIELFQETYPDYQVDFEQMSNKQWNNMLRKFGLLSKDSEDLDVWFGPRIFKNTPEVTQFFLDEYQFGGNSKLTLETTAYRPDRYSNATFIPIPAALNNHLRVISQEVLYRHPEIQTRIEKNSEDYRKKRESMERNHENLCRFL